MYQKFQQDLSSLSMYNKWSKYVSKVDDFRSQWVEYRKKGPKQRKKIRQKMSVILGFDCIKPHSSGPLLKITMVFITKIEIWQRTWRPQEKTLGGRTVTLQIK